MLCIAVAFAFVEQILTQSGSVHRAVAHAVDVLDSTRDLMDVAGFPPSMYEDLLTIYKSIVQQIVIPDINGEVMTPEILLEAFQSPEGTQTSHHLVQHPRLTWYLQCRTRPCSTSECSRLRRFVQSPSHMPHISSILG